MLGSASDLFKGTANYYAKYRIPYPKEFIEMIAQFYSIDGKGTLLDLGCGTGQLTIPLSPYFNNCIGIDTSTEMLQVAEEQNTENNIQWFHLPAERMHELNKSFTFIVSGNSFHWMNREKVLQQCYNSLTDNGGMVIIAGGSVWNEQHDWQKSTVKVIKKWLGSKRRAGSTIYGNNEKRHEEIIKESRFKLLKTDNFIFHYTWTVETIIGYLYSTSFCNRELLGENCFLFEEELTNKLLEINPEGNFNEKVELTYFFLKK